ncbi:serine threonine- kinase WAG1-like [Olea europaea subsp. europaea]|uniref:non-specific serine/threonine protein kinase n=1 Tax=Olea europaea subsp. europaea TaxID=158383 RepID=A0A8S0RYI9_OLEEU|nr:serine threonine- kinase WAG1-like [Olea europaea subsp. europaea]
MDIEEFSFNTPDSDLDFSFTSCASASTTTTTDRTLSARSSLARSSLTLSFNDRLSTTSTTTPSTVVPSLHHRPHSRHKNPNWEAIKAVTTLSSDGALHLRHLKLLRLVGSGNLGRVFLCRLRDYDHANFALKVVDRDSLTSKKLSHVQTEAQILSSLDHPFLPTLYAHLEASHYTCLLMDYCPKGDLHSLLSKQPGNRLPAQAVRFYTAEILLALEYLHAQGIVYRDLKPENILIREDGHIMLSDFDLCFNSDVSPKLENRTEIKSGSRKSCFSNRKQEEQVTEFVAEPTTAFSRSCVGTHEYLAPELVNGNGHGNGVDWWAFGVLIYELLYGTTPFKGASKESTLRNIASTKGVRFHSAEGEREEPGMAEARDLIEKLLVKDPRRRLGCTRGATDIKCHPFFNGVKWPLIRTYRPPEVRGLAIKRSKSKTNSSYLTGVLTPRRRCFWKRLSYLMRIKGSKYNLNSNHNYYTYIHNKNKKFT